VIIFGLTVSLQATKHGKNGIFWLLAYQEEILLKT
jgi:hypothetical protein